MNYIKIFIERGMVVDVEGLPEDYGFEVVDRDCEDYGLCVECGREQNFGTDIQLCDSCMTLFDTEKLWLDNDSGIIDALDFNEDKNIREQYRIVK